MPLPLGYINPYNLPMKSLLVIRHAKSDWSKPGQADFDRSLNDRGRTNAPEMAQRLLRRQYVPQLMVSSPALRAWTTSRLIASVWNYPETAIQPEPAIYEASVATLVGVLNRLDDRYDFVSITGHNPGVTDLVGYLTGTSFVGFPTCATALIRFDLDEWAQISGSTGSLAAFDYPKNQNE